ncbi:hypothetical protein cyc_08484 [Cyclospora cayetanensis]|uniref:NUP210 Ig-like domain-containing protein n=1 Tax=Cyclospora cayetanensis TaxID=88456 RepID=A0A1D3CT27_9EIME|nr:hypothetical protein cyc_08484 [Cyclospora cayetanensis]
MDTRRLAARHMPKMLSAWRLLQLQLTLLWRTMPGALFGARMAASRIVSPFSGALSLRIWGGTLVLLLFAGLMAAEEQPQQPFPPLLPEGLSIGPSQVLLPWIPPSHTAQFPAVRAQLQLEGSKGSLEGHDICFYWAVQNPQVLSLLHPDCSPVHPAALCRIDGGQSSSLEARRKSVGAAASGSTCFSRVLVEALPQSVGRRASSWIFASEETSFSSDVSSEGSPQYLQASGRAFRSQVLVAPIVQLSFSTRDKRLAIGQLGDVSLIAYDAEGNVFSSLEGLPFVWDVEGEGHIVQVEPVEADAVAGTQARRLVEEVGAKEEQQRGGKMRWRSDAIVLRGKSTGKATVRARLAVAEYGEVPPAEVHFVIHELVALSPAVLLVPPAAVFSLRLLRLWEDGRQEPLPLPNPAFHWHAEDVSVVSTLSGPLAVPSEGASQLLQVTDGGVVTASGQLETAEGMEVLTGRALVVCSDLRIGEKQQADVAVVVPSALRLLYEDTEGLSAQAIWKRMTAAASTAAAASAAGSTAGKGSSNAAGDAGTMAEKAVLLRLLQLSEEPQIEDGRSGVEVSTVLPPLRLSATPHDKRSSEGRKGGLLYLVKGYEYLFKAELLGSLAERGDAGALEDGVSRLLLPSNAVLHWTCKDAGEAPSSENGRLSCPLEKSVASQQAYALFRASALGEGMLQVSLLQIGSSPAPVWRGLDPPTATVKVRVVAPVAFRLLPTLETLEKPSATGAFHRMHQRRMIRRLTVPLFIAPGSRISLEPVGGSGEYGLSSSDPSVCTITAASPRGAPFSSSGLLSRIATAPTELFTVQGGHAAGVASLLLWDLRQPQNAVLLTVVVAPPSSLEMRLQHFLLPLVKETHPSHKKTGASFAETTAVAIAFADLSESLPLLPEASRLWLQSSGGEGERKEASWGSASGSAAFPAWPQTLEAAREYMRGVVVAAEEGIQEGSSDAEEDAAIASMPHRQPLHPFWISSVQLASCPEAQFAVEGNSVVITTKGEATIPYTCGVVSLRGIRKGSASLTATIHQHAQQRLRATARLDVYLPLELWMLMSSPVLPLPQPARLSSSRMAPLLQRLTEDPRTTTSATPSGAAEAALRAHLDLQPPGGPSANSETLLQYGEEEASVVAVVSEASGSLTRVICLQPSRIPVAIQFRSLQESKQPAITASREDTASLLISCGLPEMVELRALPSLSQPYMDMNFGAAAEKVVPSLARKSLGGLPVPSATLTAAKALTISLPRLEEMRQEAEKASEGLFLQCGALHVFSVFAYDAKLRALHGTDAFATQWEFEPVDSAAAALTSRQQQKEVSTKPIWQVLPHAASERHEAFSRGASLGVLAVPPSLCCGAFTLRAVISPPERPHVARLKEALPSAAWATLEASLSRWREAADAGREQQQQLPLWKQGHTQDSLTLLLSPPLRLLPSSAALLPGSTAAAAAQPAAAAAQPAAAGAQQRREIETVRLLYLPGHISRLLVQFGSPDTEAFHIAASPSAPTAAAGGGSLRAGGMRLVVHGELVGASRSATTPSLACLSPAEAAARFAVLKGGLLDAASGAGADVLPAVEDAACVGLKLWEDLVSLPLAFPPYAFSRDPFTPSCPLSVRELFIPSPPLPAAAVEDPLLQQQLQQQRLPTLLLEASDTRLLSPWQSLDASSSSSSSGSSGPPPQLVARVQFVRLRSVRLVLLPTPLSVSLSGVKTGGAGEGGEEKREGHFACSGGEEASAQQHGSAEIEAGKIYGVRVDLIADDGAPVDPRYFSAVRLSLTARRTAEGSSKMDGKGVEAFRESASVGGEILSPFFQGGFNTEAPLAAASYGATVPSEEATLPALFGLPEGWNRLSSLSIEEAGCAHFFLAASDVQGSFVLHAEAHEAPPAYADAAAAAALGAAAITTHLTVRIHPPLQLVPRELVLLPGGHSFELTLRGGPEEALLNAESGRGGSGAVGDGVSHSSKSEKDGNSKEEEYSKRFAVEDARVARLSKAFPQLLLTGEEGETRVFARLLQHSAGGKKLLAEAVIPVVVALPRSGAIRHGPPLPPLGGTGVARGASLQRSDGWQATLPSPAARVGYSRAAMVAAGAASGEGSGGELQHSSTIVYLGHVVPLHAALFDKENRQFTPPHLLLPTGPLRNAALASRNSEEEAQRELHFGALGLMPHAGAVQCQFSWEVRGSSGALLLAPLDAPDGEPAFVNALSPPAADAAGEEAGEEDGSSSWQGFSRRHLKGQTQLQARGLAEVLLLGASEGEARVALTVACFRNNRPVVSFSAGEHSSPLLPN